MLLPPDTANLPQTRRAFTLIELLVVVAIMVVLMTLAVPAFNAMRGGTDFATGVYNIAGTLDQARAYAIANNTYVLAGITEVSASQDSSASPQNVGTGRVVMGVVASKSGTRPYQNLLDPTRTLLLKNWDSSSYVNTAFTEATRLLVVPNMHLVDLQNAASAPPAASGSPLPNMARPAVTSYYNLSYAAYQSGTAANAASSIGFTWPPTVKFTATGWQYKFLNVIEFDPQGCARLISANNAAASYPDAVPQYIEIGLQPARGAIVAGPPASQSNNPGQIAAIQVNGISGAVRTYRP